MDSRTRGLADSLSMRFAIEYRGNSRLETATTRVAPGYLAPFFTDVDKTNDLFFGSELYVQV